jgi:hypothetical protein
MSFLQVKWGKTDIYFITNTLFVHYESSATVTNSLYYSLRSPCKFRYDIPVFLNIAISGVTKGLIILKDSTRHVTSCNALVEACNREPLSLVNASSTYQRRLFPSIGFSCPSRKTECIEKRILFSGNLSSYWF